MTISGQWKIKSRHLSNAAIVNVQSFCCFSSLQSNILDLHLIEIQDLACILSENFLTYKEKLLGMVYAAFWEISLIITHADNRMSLFVSGGNLL